ncbi:MAG: hypothetical protein HC765_04275 [Brachymonas sp.]|nr:hypothetical protein [Brachymonas sp.]
MQMMRMTVCCFAGCFQASSSLRGLALPALSCAIALASLAVFAGWRQDAGFPSGFGNSQTTSPQDPRYLGDY